MVVKAKYTNYQAMYYQHLGPFKISGKINDFAFCLDLPSHMLIHALFHVDLLEPCALSSISRRVIPPRSPIQLVDGLEYKVKEILHSKIL